MDQPLAVFRTPAGEAESLAAYDALMARIAVPSEERLVTTRLGTTHVCVSGPPDAPPLLLIHAFYATAASWYRNVDALSRSHRVFNVDIVGDPNRSRPARLIRKAADYVDWIGEVMDALGLARASFVANSVGAFHAASFALHAPRRVSRQVLIAPAATFLPMPRFYLHTFPGGMLGWKPLVQHAVRWIENGVACEPEFRRLFFLALQHGKSANQVFPRILTDEELRRMETPTLLLYGDREVIYDTSRAIDRARRLVPHLTAEVVPGANHLTGVCNPEVVNATILRFLSGAGREARRA